MSEVSVDAVARTMRVLLERTGRPLCYRDPANGAWLTVDAETAAEASGFLPALVVAGEAVWREATGKGFAVEIVRDAKALLGYRLGRIGAGTFATVMLAAMEAINQVARPEAVVVSDLNRLWSAATSRIRREKAIGLHRGEEPRA